MKNKFLIIVGSIIVVLVAIIAIFGGFDNTEYLTEINFDEFVEKIDNEETFIIYIKQTGCSHCQDFTPKFETVLKNYKVNAYYLNLTNLDEDEQDSFEELLEVEGTPMVFFYKDGKKLTTTINGDQEKSIIIKKLKLAGFISE